MLPIYGYGHPVLRKTAKDINKNHEGLNDLVKSMFETMYESEGVGLAAPQIGKSIRLFVIDASPLAEDDSSLKAFKQVFINAKITNRKGSEWAFTEGCLSIPNIREDVYRPQTITIKYRDLEWNEHEETFDNIKARIIQHEYDHIEGILFTDRLASLKKRLLKSRLTAITKGKVDVNYKMKFA